MGLQGLYGKLGKMCNNGWKCHFPALSEVLLLVQRDALCLNSQCIILLGNLVEEILLLQMLQSSGLVIPQILHLFEVLKA